MFKKKRPLDTYIGRSGVFSLVDEKIDSSGVEILFWNVTGTPGNVISARTLTVDLVTVSVIGAAKVALARFASLWILRKTVILGFALVAVASDYVTFAGTLARDNVAALIVNRAVNVAFARLASLRIFHGEVPEAVFATIATTTFHVGLAVASTGLVATQRIRSGVADTVVQRASWIAVASYVETFLN